MKKSYILSLLLASGLLFFSFVNSSLAADVCGEEPYPHCDDLCAKLPEKTPQYDACYDPCYSEYLTADDKYRACQQAEYDKQSAIYAEQSNYDDQRAAAEKTRQEEEKACNDLRTELAKKELANEKVCYDAYNACYAGCRKQDPSNDATEACVKKTCETPKQECKDAKFADYENETKNIVEPCLTAAYEKFNQKMDLIRQHNWPELQKILDEEDRQTEQKKFTDEKAKLEAEKAKNPDLTTISTGGRGVAVLKPDGSWKTVYAETDIEAGDVIYTKSNSATINYSDGSKIDLGPGSSIKYSDSKILMGLKIATENAVEKKINLLRGKIKLWGKKFEVRTPNAALAARATEFIVDYNPDAKVTTAYLYEGILDVSNLKNQTQTLQQGETTTVDASGTMVSGKLDQGQWEQLSGGITNPQPAQTGVAKQGATGKTSGKTMTWLIPAVVVICIIGAGAFVYLKRKS
jgi:hypothetical protein